MPSSTPKMALRVGREDLERADDRLVTGASPEQSGMVEDLGDDEAAAPTGGDAAQARIRRR